MNDTRRTQRRSALRFTRLAAAMCALSLGAGCLDTTGVGLGAPGNALIVVTDQNDAPVTDARVTLEQRAGGRVTQSYTRLTNVQGQIQFDAVGSGNLLVWADPPAGYSGGGESRAEAIEIIAGQTVNKTVKLTKP
jgi:hypothetical protein